MSDTDIHDYQSSEFPKMKSPMDVNNHPEDRNPTTEHEDGTPSASLADRIMMPRAQRAIDNYKAQMRNRTGS